MQDYGDGSYVPLINAPSPDLKQPMEGSNEHKSALKAKYVEEWKVSSGESEDKDSFKVEKHKKISIKCETAAEGREEKTNAKKKKNKKGERQSPQEGSGVKTDSLIITPMVNSSAPITPSEGIYSVI